MKDHEIRELVNQLRDIAIKYHGTGQLRGQIALVVRAAMLQLRCSTKAASALDSSPKTAEARSGNSPVIPEGYVMVPKEPTKEMIDAGWLHFMGTKNPSSKGTYKAMLAAAEQEVPDGK